MVIGHKGWLHSNFFSVDYPACLSRKMTAWVKKTPILLWSLLCFTSRFISVDQSGHTLRGVLPGHCATLHGPHPFPGSDNQPSLPVTGNSTRVPYRGHTTVKSTCNPRITGATFSLSTTLMLQAPAVAFPPLILATASLTSSREGWVSYSIK